jgi:hypothetical protein
MQSNKKKLGIFGLASGAVVGVLLTLGSLTTADGSMWQKIKNTVEIFPRNTALIVDAFTKGGTVIATSTTSTSFGTFTEAQMLAGSLITLTPNVSSATSTLPATSTMTTLLAGAGDSRSWQLYNATGTSAITVGIAAGTGINITSNTLRNVQIAPGGSADLTCSRMTNTDVVCSVNILVAGD